MQQQDILIINKLGLHARAAAKFVSLASGFDSEIKLIKDNNNVNGKSIMGIMMLAAARGTTLTITASGSDEADAIKKLKSLVDNRFDEEE